jgi:hypothetical protein
MAEAGTAGLLAEEIRHSQGPVGSVDANLGILDEVVRQRVDEEEECSAESGDPGQQANYAVLVAVAVADRKPGLASVLHREDRSHEDPEPDPLCIFDKS